MKRIIVFISVVLIISIFLTAISLPIYFYLKNLYTPQFSQEIKDWGYFGDYIGGLISPMISFANLLILIYLAYLARNFEKLSFLSSRKISYFKDITKKIDEYISRLLALKDGDKTGFAHETQNLIKYFKSIKQEMDILLPKFNKTFNEFLLALETFKDDADIDTFYYAKNKLYDEFKNLYRL